MNKPNILEKLDELFGGSETPNMAKLETLIAETLKFFEYIRHQMQSGNEEDRKAAVELAQQLQHKLEGLADKSLAASGMSREQLYSFLANSKNFTGDEWNRFKAAEQEIQDYRKEVIKEPAPKTPPKTSKKNEWLKS
jgi:hypothetical protein